MFENIFDACCKKINYKKKKKIFTKVKPIMIVALEAELEFFMKFPKNIFSSFPWKKKCRRIFTRNFVTMKFHHLAVNERIYNQ
jgi:hypothetical protein